MRRICVLVYEGVTLLDVAGPMEVFHEANTGEPRYELSVVGMANGIVRSSSGLGLATERLVEDQTYDTVIIPGSDGVPTLDPRLVKTVRHLASRSRRVVSVCTGSFLLAEAGLLDGLTATTHWRYADVLRRSYPRVQVEPDVIVVDSGKQILTSAGVSAGIDLALMLVELDHGTALARDVSRSLVVFLHRAGGQSQFSARTRLPVAGSATIRAVMDSVTGNPAAAHTVASLAQFAKISTRHLTRLFQTELGVTPSRFIELTRIESAQHLLLGGASVTSAAGASGFGSDEVLRRAFQREMGVTPSTYRARFTTTRA